MFTMPPNAMPVITAQAATITQAYGCSRSSKAFIGPDRSVAQCANVALYRPVRAASHLQR